MELHVEMCTNLEKCLRNDLDCLNDIQSHSFKPDMFAAAGSINEADRESPKAAGTNGEENLFSETKQDNDQTRTEVNVVHPRCKRQNIKHKIIRVSTAKNRQGR